MSGFLNILGKLFGNKYDKDVKAIAPIVADINKQYQQLHNLTNDELRQKTIELKKQINQFVAQDRDEINTIKEKTKLKETSTEEKESLFPELYEILSGIAFS